MVFGVVPVLLLTALAAEAGPGDLDAGFGTAGRVVLDLGVVHDSATVTDVAIQADGKIVAVGSIELGPKKTDAFVTRLNTDGSPDPTFGVQRMDIGEVDVAEGVAVQPDGRIVVIGNTSTHADAVVWRFDPNGSPDPTFNQGGVVVLGSTDLSSEEKLYDVAVQPDGKIVVVGSQRFGVTRAMTMWRLSSKGQPDTTFDDDGSYYVSSSTNDVALGVDLQSDGKLVVAGLSPTKSGMTVFRINPTGGRDVGFGTGGAATVPASSPFTYDVRVLPDGGIAAIGAGVSIMDADSYLARFTPTGRIDLTFGGPIDLGSDESLNAMAIDAGGRILASGAFGGDAVVTRFDLRGHLDAGFGQSGVSELPGAMSFAQGLAVQGDGKAVTGGDDGTTLARPVVVRVDGGAPQASPGVTSQLVTAPKQRLRRTFKAQVTCPEESCAVRLGGALKVGKTSFKLQAAQLTSAAGVTSPITVKVSKKAFKKVLALLERKPRLRTKVRVTFTGTATDLTGTAQVALAGTSKVKVKKRT